MSEGEEKGLKTFSLEEVAEHTIAKGEDKSIWTVVHDRVYDVTKFLDEVSCYPNNFFDYIDHILDLSHSNFAK